MLPVGANSVSPTGITFVETPSCATTCATAAARPPAMLASSATTIARVSDAAATMASRSSGDTQAALRTRANPRLIPRNHQVEAMIAAAVEGDFAPFRRLLDTVTRPFDTPPADLTLPPQPEEEVAMTFCGT